MKWSNQDERRWQQLAKLEAFNELTRLEIEEFRNLIKRRRKHLTVHQIRK